MKKLLLIFIFSFSSATFAKSPQATKESDIRYREGLLKRISCTFNGLVRTPTGTSIGSVDFPVDPALTVCDPFSNNSSSSPSQGLLGKLILKTPEMGDQATSVMDYYNKGLKMEQKLYFADVNVPTRPFTQGFSTQDGAILVDGQGQKLIENFAVEYNSLLKLGPTDKEGDYEIATLSDDGARVFIKENGTWNELINNDGMHATRMGCPYRTISLKKDSEVPVKILYYQGPRYYIANVMIWKLHKKAKTWSEPSRHSLCGVTSNSFFESRSLKKGGKSTSLMGILNKEGWQVMKADNFKMPLQQPNPCIQEELAISDFQVVSVSAPKATVSWKTNVGATSQLRIMNIFTGEEVYTDVDNSLVTDHTAEIQGLMRGVFYQIQAISQDSQGREVRSSVLSLNP